jgi:hypothetical protein
MPTPIESSGQPHGRESTRKTRVALLTKPGRNLPSSTLAVMRPIISVLAVAAVVQLTLVAACGANETHAVTVSLSSSHYADGSANAPAGMPQLADLFRGYPVRPPWKVAGVDYYVGVPSGTVLKDPGVPGNLPAGVELNATTIRVTASNVTISGFDFSGKCGYGIYVPDGVSGTKIMNNLFVDSCPASPIPVNVASGAYNTYVGYNTINAGGEHGNQSFDETIYNLGTGLTVEYNFIENAPGRFVSVGAGSLVYRFNLLKDGGWLPGVHLNFLQFGGGTISNPVVDYNTVIQNETVSGGEGFQMYTNFPGSITNGDIGNNTVITKRTVLQASAHGPALSYLFHAGSNSQYPSPATGMVHDNYVDASSAYGAVYGGLKGFVYSNNVDLLTAAHF